jgi:alkanesulfonate monooxygenase SsuD/methylene tetrahydromethanopterin reductase-like flavin-dependent oxidoreductase (luciferase family)
VDDLSGGRLNLGVGAGWQEREHTNYGYYLGTIPERMTRLREAANIIRHLLKKPEPLTVEGKFFTLRDAVLLPRPKRPAGPPIVIGGNGKQFTLPLAARFADQWNATFRTPEQFRELNEHLDTLLDKAGRPRSGLRRTMMTRLDYADLGKVREQVTALGNAGVQRVMLQWLDLDNISGIESLARALK